MSPRGVKMRPVVWLLVGVLILFILYPILMFPPIDGDRPPYDTNLAANLAFDVMLLKDRDEFRIERRDSSVEVPEVVSVLVEDIYIIAKTRNPESGEYGFKIINGRGGVPLSDGDATEMREVAQRLGIEVGDELFIPAASYFGVSSGE